jgi:hypothetical protein
VLATLLFDLTQTQIRQFLEPKVTRADVVTRNPASEVIEWAAFAAVVLRNGKATTGAVSGLFDAAVCHQGYYSAASRNGEDSLPSSARNRAASRAM